MKNQATRLIYSAIKTPDGTVLESRDRHDYQTYTDTITGEVYMLDGGLDYQRTTVNIIPATDLSVYEDDGHEIVREALQWGTYGKDGAGPYRRVRLSEMSDEHIRNVLRDCLNIYPQFKDALRIELEYREIHNIKLED